MKAFKKLALVTAIAAAPFAQAELTSIDDAALSDMTGQAGITIELSTEVTIGSVVYTDDDGLDPAGAAGDINITGVTLGGSTLGEALDGIKIDIDVDDAKGLVIHLGSQDMAGVLSGDNSVDFGLSVDSVSLNSSATNLVSDVRIEGNLGPIDVVIADSGDITVAAYFEVTNGSLDVDVLGLGITNLTIGDNGSPILTDAAYQADIENYQGYYEQEFTATATHADTIAAAGQATAAAGAYSTAANAAGTWATDGSSKDVGGVDTPTNAAGETQAELDTAAATALATATATATAAGVVQIHADGSAAMQAYGVKGVSNMAYVGMKVTTGTVGYGKLHGTDAGTWSADTIVVTNALLVEVTAMKMDIGMSLTMGTASYVDKDLVTQDVSTSLGSVVINDLDLSGTTLAIYGH